MENREEDKTFSYTYSASQQEEIQNIRQKYLVSEEDKIEQLRRLDRNVTKKSMGVSLAAGIVGALVLGVGMCCTMVWKEIMFIPGIIIGVCGIILICLAYPLYNRIAKKEREKIAPEILRITDELIR